MEEDGNEEFHNGYNYPISGALLVDVKARKIQEAAERLTVSKLLKLHLALHEVSVAARVAILDNRELKTRGGRVSHVSLFIVKSNFSIIHGLGRWSLLIPVCFQQFCDLRTFKIICYKL